MTSSNQKKIILDCDPGMDDSVAIMLAANSPKIDLLGVVSSHGNYPIEVTTANALKIADLLGLDFPVVRGASRPLLRECPADPFSHGKDGQAENFLPDSQRLISSLKATEFIINLVNKHPGEITYVVTGPLTNLATAILADSDIVQKLAGIVSISGAFALNPAAYANATGDTPQSEWNVYVDPEAAKIVYENCPNLLAIGLDVATYFDVDFTPKQIAQLQSANSPEAHFLAQAIKFVTERGYGAYCTIIDCMAVATVINPGILTCIIKGRVGVETESTLCRGMTVLDSRHHHVWKHLPEISIAKSANYEEFLRLIIESMLRDKDI